MSPLALFSTVVFEVSLPIVMLAGLGYACQRVFGFDTVTLNRLSVWVLLPCLIFHTFATLDLGGTGPGAVPRSALLVTVVVTALQWVILLLLTWGLCLLMGVRRDLAALVGLCIAMPNSGNYAILLVELAYGPDWVVYQVVIMATQSVLLMTIGVAILSGRAGSIGRRLLATLRAPFLPAMLVGLLVNILRLPLPEFVLLPIQKLGTAMPQVAMFTLGAMLVGIRWRDAGASLAAISVARFVFAPGITAGLLLALGLSWQRLDDLFLVTAATPIAVMVAVLAADRQKDAALITAWAFVTTVLSPVAVTAVLMLTGIRTG